MKLFQSLLLSFTLMLVFPLQIIAAPNTTLSIFPTNVSYAPQSSFTSDIMINTGSNTVVSADVVLTYNPSVLEAVDVQVGTFLPGANLLQEKLDNTQGTITISLFTHKENARQGSGILAKIQWKAKNIGQNTVAFNIPKTLVYGLQEGNVLQTTVPAQLSVSNSGIRTVPTQPVAPSPTTPSPQSNETEEDFFSQTTNPPNVDSEIPGSTLPASSALNESLIDKLATSIREVFTPRGDSQENSPKQSPVFSQPQANFPFIPIILVWSIVILLCICGALLFIRKYKKKADIPSPGSSSSLSGQSQIPPSGKN